MTRKKTRNKQKVQDKENEQEYVKSGDNQQQQQATVKDEEENKSPEINLDLKDNQTNEIQVQDKTRVEEPPIKDHVNSVDNAKEDERKEIKSEGSNDDKTQNSASFLPCSVCQLPCVGPCKKCQAPLCPSCLPFHIYKARCLPWKVEAGCLVATRDIRPLEVVLQDRALVTVPTGKLSCLGCGRAVNCRYHCGTCNLPLCGVQCPRVENHRTECNLLSGRSLPKLSEADSGHPVFSAVVVIRILAVKKDSPGDWSKFSHLPYSWETIRAQGINKEHMDQVQELLTGQGYSCEEVEQAYCLNKLYGYNLPALPEGKVRSLFPLHSLLAHSCLPCLQYIEKAGGRSIVLQAVKGIAKGEKLTVRLTPFLQGRIGLTRWLREERFTTCTCQRCTDGSELGTFTSSALCPEQECRERGGLLLPVNPLTHGTDWICSSCQALTKCTEVEALEEAYVARFLALPQGDLNSYYTFLNELGERFHASHHLVMRMAQFLVFLQGKKLESLPLERIQTQSILSDKLVAYVSRLDPGATHLRAKLLLEKNKADLNLDKLDCQSGKITRKVFMQKVKEGVKVELNAKKILYFKWEDE